MGKEILQGPGTRTSAFPLSEVECHWSLGKGHDSPYVLKILLKLLCWKENI